MGFEFGRTEWTQYVPIATTIGLTIYIVWKATRPCDKVVNPNIRKDEKKVSDTIDVDDIKDKVSLCRCWRSKTFPLCDGAHKDYNKATGDNLGPVRVVRKPS